MRARSATAPIPNIRSNEGLPVGSLPLAPPRTLPLLRSRQKIPDPAGRTPASGHWTGTTSGTYTGVPLRLPPLALTGRHGERRESSGAVPRLPPLTAPPPPTARASYTG